jgi:hypothetical protein
MKKLWFEPNALPYQEQCQHCDGDVSRKEHAPGCPVGPRKVVLKKPEEDAAAVEIPGIKCQCGAEPLVVQGAGRRISVNPKLRHDTYEADAVCVKCDGHVGKLYAKMNTLFGLEEDEAVMHFGAKVY